MVELSEETINALSEMDSKDLIREYVKFYSQNQQQVQAQATSEADAKAIYDSVGGQEAYGEMVGWAAHNLSQDEIDRRSTVSPTLLTRLPSSLLSRPWPTATRTLRAMKPPWSPDESPRLHEGLPGPTLSWLATSATPATAPTLPSAQTSRPAWLVLAISSDCLPEA